jgi:predicted nucleic acid-binding protein
LLVDTSVARNFGVLDWSDHLVALCGGVIRVAHGVLGLEQSESGELDGIRASIERETRTYRTGSPESSLASAALVGIERLIARRGQDLEVVQPTEEELALAVRLQDSRQSNWLRSLGVRARRLDAGEAVSIAIAVHREQELGSDDSDGRRAYLGLGGTQHWWTLDLVQKAVALDLLPEDVARGGYSALRERHRFWGERWE